jgi:hypothetical protein
MIMDSNDFDIENWWNETSSIVQGLIGGAIAVFLLTSLFALHYLYKSSESSDSVALLNEEQDLDNEEIWTKQQQPPAYVEEEEEKQPFLSDNK